MASFEKVNRGVRAVVSNGTGKNRVKKSRTFQTMKQAKSWAREVEIQNEINQQDGVIGDFNFGQLFDEYALKVSPQKKGVRWELLRLGLLKRFPLSDVSLKDACLFDIEQYIEERLRTVKSSTVNRELNLISHCITKAQHWRWIPKHHNPMEGLQRPKNPPHRDRLISPLEKEMMCLVLGYSEESCITTMSQEVAVAWLYSIDTAMRAGEVTDICTTCCDMKANVVELVKTKNGSKRVVPMSPRGNELLSKMYAKSKHAPCPYSLPIEKRPKRYQPLPGETPIFHNHDCKRLFKVSAGSLSSLFRKYRKKTNIVDLTFHDARHEAITNLAKLYTPYDLARIVGHKDIKQLMTYYNRSPEDIAREMAENHSKGISGDVVKEFVTTLGADQSQIINLLVSLLQKQNIKVSLP